MSKPPFGIVLGDTHIGARRGSKYMRQFIRDYLIDHVITYCKQHDIKRIFQLGDMFDVRAALYARDYDMAKNELVPALREAGVKLYTFPGNHDIALADSTDMSWTNLAETVGDGHIINFESPDDYNIDGVELCVIPWVCKDNYEDVVSAIEYSESKVCLGHFEFQGFEMYNGSYCETGSISTKLFEKFSQVLTGHFHTRSESGNIRYVGAPYHLTWQDYPDGTNRGFELMNVDDSGDIKFEFVPNSESQSVFRVFHYDQEKDENFKKYGDPKYLDKELGFEGQIVRIQVTNLEQSKHQYQKFIDALKSCKAIDYMVVNKTELVATSEITVDETVLQMDVLQILNDKIEKTSGLSRDSVKAKLADINKIAQDSEIL